MKNASQERLFRSYINLAKGQTGVLLTLRNETCFFVTFLCLLRNFYPSKYHASNANLQPLHSCFLCSVDKSDYMVGSYGPRPNEYEFLTPLEEAPKGMLARGTYNMKSKFTDDDKHDHLSWEWNLNIKKEWKD